LFLQVLYLYDNQIELIQNLGFASILQYLYLHNNLIKEIPNLPMPALKKLYLDDNEIQTVSGLSSCTLLEELHIARQRLPSYAALKFQPESLNSISRALQVLEISGNGITQLAPFSVLYNLRKLYCQDNKIIDLSEIEVIVALPRLEEANFTGNPCCQQFKYRDTAIGASSDSFQILDELPIPKHQQIAIRGLMVHRRKIGAMSRFQRAINADSTEQSQMELQYQSQSQSRSLEHGSGDGGEYVDEGPGGADFGGSVVLGDEDPDQYNYQQQQGEQAEGEEGKQQQEELHLDEDHQHHQEEAKHGGGGGGAGARAGEYKDAKD
jgi:protein phosphatase 1 regulatory subunit 42